MKKVFLLTAILALSTSLTQPLFAANEKNPYGTATIDPAGAEEVILTLTKGDRKVHFAYPRLLKMKSSTISIYEPFLKKRQSFTVIKLQSLFSLAGISGKDKVTTTALNDYIYANSAANFIAADGYLAIKRGGAPIGYDQGGPIRIIFPDDSKWAKNLDAWNWSIAAISVK